ncbi:MAG: hypothetical protein JRI23_03490 [Deltaproteobacteria bacterium]|jgi:hypothetical protein|nr:hypothetical protein [Deltaproteobacteria bacterium]MBW2530579.1 hypothetical protein [Deltaproteobacteria bacterium]
MGFRLVRVAAFLLATLLAVGAYGGEPSAAEKETARQLVKSGRKKMNAGDLQAALADLEAAHAIMGVPTTGLALGVAQERAGKLVEARDTMLAVWRMPKERREPRAYRRARSEAEKRAQELATRIPALRIEVTGSAAADAEVSVGGQALLPAAVGRPFKVNPGEHEIVARSGDQEDRVVVTVAEGETRDVRLAVDAGVSTEADTTTGAPGSDPGIHPLTWVGLGVGAAGVIVGTITGALALDKHAEIAPRCPAGSCPPDTHDDLDAGLTLGTVSTVSFIVGGLGAAVATVGLLLPVGGDEATDAAWLRVSPAALAVGGSF